MVRRHSLIATVLLTAIIGTASAATPGAKDGSKVSAEIDQILSGAFHSDAPGASVLVVEKGEVVLRKGYGVGDMELGVAVDPGQVFRVCSITKQFTAVAILQLVEAGKVRLEDEIGKYVPEYPTGGSHVTLAELLSHTSGIPSIEAQPEWLKAWRQDMSVTELLAFTKEKPLDFVPGTDFKYSNTGYFLLGEVIEKASGQSYADYVQTHIFTPAGMTNSSYGSENRITPHRVPGYVRAGKGWANAPFISMSQLYSAGAILSTVDDLWKWEQALAGGKLVDSVLLAKAYTEVKLPDGGGTNYGGGWELGKIGSHGTIEHGGGIPGFAAEELRIPDSDIYIAILCNTSDVSASPRSMAARIARVVLGEPIVAATTGTTVSTVSLEDYVGSYRIAPNQQFVITSEGGKLMGQLGGGRRPLKGTGVDEFSTPGGEMRMTFVRDTAHRVDRVEVRSDGPGPVMEWPRENLPVK